MEDDLIQRIKDTYDTDELIDRLQLTIDELVDLLYDTITDNADKFEELDDVDEDLS